MPSRDLIEDSDEELLAEQHEKLQLPGKSSKRFSTVGWVQQYTRRGQTLSSIVEQMQQFEAYSSSTASSSTTTSTTLRSAHVTFEEPAEEEMPLNILVLDGGGMKGFAHEAMWKEMNAIVGEDRDLLGTSLPFCHRSGPYRWPWWVF